MIFSYNKKHLYFPYINKILLSALFYNIHKREINEGNSLSSSDAGAYVCIIFVIKLGQTEVRYLRIKIFIKQNISSLDVSMNNLWLSTDSRQHLDRFICRELVLERFSIALDPSSFVFLYIVSARFFFFFSFLSDLSRQKLSFLSPIQFSLNLYTFPTWFSAQTLCSSCGMISFLSFYYEFHSFWPRFLGFLKNFGIFENWWGFCEIFRLGYV